MDLFLQLTRLVAGIILCSFISAQGFAQSSGPTATPKLLIKLSVSVYDKKKGAFLKDLKAEDFEISEGKVVHSDFNLAPRIGGISTGFLIDTSHSGWADTNAANARLDAIVAGLHRFVDGASPESDFFIQTFGDNTSNIQGLTVDRGVITGAIDRLNKLTVGGTTSIFSALYQGVSVASTGRHSRRALIVISDGLDTNSTESAKNRWLDSRKLILNLSVFMVDPTTRSEKLFPRPVVGNPPMPGSPALRADDKALSSAVKLTGGSLVSATNDKEFQATIDSIIQQLANEYNLEFPAPLKEKRQWHTISLKFKRPNPDDFRVYAPTGYFF